MSEKKPRLLLIDGSSYIYRAFFAIRHLSNSKGFPTNAIYGFTNMLLKVLREEEPEYLAIAFDAPGPTFRHEVFGDYKAHRPSMPENLRPQIPRIKEIVAALRIPVLEKEGFEADDLIGTLVKKMEVAEKIVLHINYASNSAEPDAASKKLLDSIAYRIMAYPDTKVEVRGFTDDRNTEAYNLDLSQKRAEGVMAYLKTKGVQDNQMTAKGFGEDPKYFVADNKTAAGRRENRRVEIESVK